MNDYPPCSQLEDHARLQPSDRYAATIVASILQRGLAPGSVLHLGCGNGVWLNAFADRGRCTIQGVEEVPFAPRDLAVNPAHVLTASLARPIMLDRRFDLVICLEAPDHVEPSCGEILVENCTRHGDSILFSTGLPGQSEWRDEDFWGNAFRTRGFVGLDLIRPQIWYDPRVPLCYRQNLLLFVRQDAPPLASLHAEAKRVARFSPLTLAEPGWTGTLSSAAELDDHLAMELVSRLTWQATQLERALAAQQASQDKALSLEDEIRRLRQEAVRAHDKHDTLQKHIDELGTFTESLRRELAAVTAELDCTQSTVAVLRQERAIILGSTIWRATEPLRAFGRSLPLPVRLRMRQTLQGFAQVPRALAGLRPRRRVRTTPLVAIATDVGGDVQPVAAGSSLRVLIVSGEPHTPGHAYRVLRLAAAMEACGVAVSWMHLDEAEHRKAEIAQAQLVVIWRAPLSTTTSAIVKAARASGAKIVFDLDDLMMKPELARIDIIDGIRSQRFNADETARLFGRVQKLMLQADICTCTTNELADHIREYQKIAVVLPNGFDDKSHRTARAAVRRRQAEQSDSIIRIGYASGSRTHQRDFAEAAEAIARLLQKKPECRLVLFRDPRSGEPVVDPAEFAVLKRCKSQIEWRDLVPLEQLPTEIARFDINVVPLETGNPFCEAKSELKYFEAALVEVCTVASRTGPLSRAIRDRVNGRLVDSSDSWYEALSELAANRALRQEMAHAAYLDSIWRFGPRRREELVQSLLDQVSGGETAARAFELELRRSNRPAPRFDIPPSEIIYGSDTERPSELTVILPLYNYAHYVTEALESVRLQTIEALDLIIVDDCSTDTSPQVALDWARINASRFNRILVMQNRENSGLARSRNVGFDRAETPYVLPLDADNRLLPGCCASMLQALQGDRAAFAYPRIQCFGEANHVIGDEAFSPARFSGGNYVDAMALVCKWAWAAVGGYTHIQHGWEDYDFWCRCVEHGFWGLQVPEVLAEYRVHKQSMLQTQTDRHENKLKLIRDLNACHGWLSIPYRA